MERAVFAELCRKAERGISSSYWKESAAKCEGVDKRKQSKLYAALFRVSLVWSPASASATAAREAPAVFFPRAEN